MTKPTLKKIDPAVLNAKPTYTYKEVLENAIAYFKGDELAASTWINKYAMKNKEGQFEELTPDDMHQRMASEFARIEQKFTEKALPEEKKANLSEYGRKRAPLTQLSIYQYFRNFGEVIPQGSVMSSLGNPHVIASLSNCIVLPEIYDSYGGIFYTDQQLAQLFKRRLE